MRKNRNGVSAALKWLIICFPYGLYRMWRRDCEWNKIIKVAVTGVIALAIAAVIILPSPTKTSASNVTLVGEKKDVKVLGPELPKGYDAARYPTVSNTASVLNYDTVKDDTVYVYLSGSNDKNKFYHAVDCKYAYASSKYVTLYEAYMLGYRTPCQLCNPPVYQPE